MATDLDTKGKKKWICTTKMFGYKELGTNVLELHFVMLANHDQNVLILFRLA